MSPLGIDPCGETLWENVFSTDHYADPALLIPPQLLHASTQKLTKVPDIIAEQSYGNIFGQKANKILWIYYQNIHGFTCLEEMYEYMLLMKEYEVDIFGWSETNTNWTLVARNKVGQMGRRTWKIFKLVASCSDDPADEKQQGGTCIGLVNDMVGQHVTSGEDMSGLGRWSYVKIAGRDQCEIVCINVYKLCVQSNLGDNTVTVQYNHLLTTQGVKETNPQKAWDRDLLKQLDQLREAESEIFFMVDANSGIADKEFGEFLAESQLYDMIGSKHAINSPKMHINGNVKVL
eukprot:15367006-Ditylum_brightwellii.AAC.2